MIRDAAPDDASWIADIWNDVIAHTHITFTTTLKTVPEIEAMIRDRVFLVLPDQGGFATYGAFRRGLGYVATVEHTIFLAKHARGKGQGKRLLSALEGQAGDAGHHVMVAAISSENQEAAAFHKAMGYDTVAEMPEVGRKGGRWLDLILMQKQLGATESASAKSRDSV
ncbi:N-acetyltransferase [Tateyamaria omphalii]|uniref:GNAT family N-acetyltransferase n=1 Tax=Tateyamaria omphalii TaxID=299262 RepID=UPI001675DBE0|nr:GNAT family N-acetyltransferase [Tateyamaria omphalii]GGX50383.1 N-acetyltransferase [Tateyamaria omphalii]